MSRILFAIALISVSAATQLRAAVSDEPSNAPRTDVTAQGIYAVKQLVTPDFDLLPLKRKLYAYYLTQAVAAGRDIAWTQDAKDGLEIRTLMEQVWENSEYLSPTLKAGLEEYFFRVVMNHGNYEEKKNEKFIPEKFTSREFETMIADAELSAGRKGLGLSLRAEAHRLQKAIFDKSFHTQFLATSPADLVADSSTDFYGPGITQADLEKLPEAERDHFLSYPVRGPDGKITLQLHRIGGRFDRQLRMIHFFFEKAKEFATPAEITIISAFQEAIKTGDPEDQLEAERLWVQYKPTDVDFVLGFEEVYTDPLGKRGEWEGFVLVKTQNPRTINRVRNTRSNNDYFESVLPVAEEFKKAPGFTPPHAEGAYMLYSGGAAGETPFQGVNLPNDPGIRAKFGSKSFTAINVMNPIGPKNKALQESEDQTFYSPKYLKRLETWDRELAADTQVEFHEILGHGSGKNRPGVTDLDLKEYYNPLEEARAETASLYHLLDLKVRDLDILPKTMSDTEFRDFVELKVVNFFTTQLRGYYLLADDTKELRQAHQWGRQVMFNWLLHDGSLRVVLSNEGVPQVEVVNLDRIRQCLGEFWRQIQEAKGTGNYQMAKDIFEKWGVYGDVHKKWRSAIVSAVDRLQIMKKSVLMNPRLLLVKDVHGQVIDVQLRYASGEGLGVLIREQLRLTHENDKRQACVDLLTKAQ